MTTRRTLVTAAAPIVLGLAVVAMLTVVSVEELSGLPIPTPPEPTDAEKIAALQQQLDALLDALGGE